MSKWDKEKSNLEKLILEESKSYEEIGRAYGCSGSNIKKIAKKLGINILKRRKINPKETFGKGKGNFKCLNCGKPIKSPNKYCSPECCAEHHHKERYKDFLDHPENYKRADYSPRSFKKDILNEQGGVCAICGCKPEWNGKPLVFILDHIDGHASNNSRANLRMICPNCDTQLDTFKGRNVHNGERTFYKVCRSSPEETKEDENPLNDES
jgi:rubrerythrin